jgi:hypothetical protein
LLGVALGPIGERILPPTHAEEPAKREAIRDAIARPLQLAAGSTETEKVQERARRPSRGGQRCEQDSV